MGEAEPAEGLSPFSARILDQLSLTAWLPAALVIANGYLVVGMYMVRENNGNKPTVNNMKDAVSALDSKPIGVIVAVLFGVVLLTLVTQSLEFAAIRLLEGYWGGSVLVALPTWIGVKMQMLALALIDRRTSKLQHRAFAASVDEIVEEIEEPRLAEAVRRIGLREPTANLDQDSHRPELLDDAQRYFDQADWLPLAPANLRHRVNSLYIKRDSYPDDESRMMPTRLGNALRRFETRLQGNVEGGEMRGYLYERVDAIGQGLLRRHRQYRNRLDLYAVMTLVCVSLALFNAVLMPAVLPRDLVVGVVVTFVALAFVNYRGAISAAMDYGPILLAMDRVSASRTAEAVSRA